ncbi:transposase [Sporolactobacillus inulinus]|uniref:transposase n=1 Tax=Sporolactobacillus inulinus TaxID=2078 RepID=UPI0021CD02D5|nr:transposase [Sporolactobacillus inulinus]
MLFFVWKYAAFDVKKLERQVTQWQSTCSHRRHLAKVNVAFDQHHKVSSSPRELEDFSNWQKARKRKATLQAKIANQRKDYLHKLTTQLIKHYDVIVIEDLKTKNLLKNHSGGVPELTLPQPSVDSRLIDQFHRGLAAAHRPVAVRIVSR